MTLFFFICTPMKNKIILTYLYFNICNINIFGFVLEKNIEKSCRDERVFFLNSLF